MAGKLPDKIQGDGADHLPRQIFLDRVVNRIVEIVGGKAEFYGGNYSFYVAEKEARYQEQLKRYEWEQKEAKRRGGCRQALPVGNRQ